LGTRLQSLTMRATPVYFRSAAEFRDWLELHHAEVEELWVGFHKKGSGKPSLTWPESVDCALCFGWIDGVRRSVSEDRYTIRFSPRKPSSTWSAINMRRVPKLTRLGLMRPAGLAAFARRRNERSQIYSYEQRRDARLPTAFEKELRANREAWDFFQSQPPWYRRVSAYWVISAKKEDTRLKRLATLIEDSARGRTIKPLTRPKKAR